MDSQKTTLEAAKSAHPARLELDEGPVSFDATGASTAATRRTTPTLIDLSDVFFYLRHHATVSGIQRVQLGIAKAIGELDSDLRTTVSFITETEDRQNYVIISNGFIYSIWKELSADKVDHGQLLTLMESATARGTLYAPNSGDVLLILGAFWVLENVAERIIELRREGVHVGVLIHDVIPITHPEFCERPLTDAFRSYFASVVSVVGFILTVSDHTGKAVKAFLERINIKCPTVMTLRLAHKTWDPPTLPSVGSSNKLSRLVRDEFVLYVSTIEIRKNHTYLFRIWKRLIESRGKDVPSLVFVGRAGWRVDDLMAQLNSTNYLNGKIKILHDLSDNELARLYRSALFTVFPSFEEGWGLPVGESLLFGRPCLASNTSSVPEVGGEFVDYFDPFNDNDGFQKIAGFIDDRQLLEERAETIAKRFKPRLWGDVARDLLEAVDTLVPDGSAAGPVPLHRLLAGDIRRSGHRHNISNFIDSGDANFAYGAFDTNWYPVEEFGRWLRGGEGRIVFALDKPITGEIVLAIGLCTVGWLGESKLQIAVNGQAFDPLALPAGQHQNILLRAQPESETITLDFSVHGTVQSGEDLRTDLCYGVRWVGYASIDDPIAHVQLIQGSLIDRGLFTQACPIVQ